MTVDIRVETRSAGEGDLSGRPHLPEALGSRIDEIADAVLQVTSSLKARLDRDLDSSRETQSWSLDQVEMAFSLDLEAEAGVVISRVSTTAGFEVTLTWSRPAG